MSPTDVVFLSTAWGPRLGGEGAFNRDLAVALAKFLRAQPALRVACVVPSGVVESRENDGVVVLSLGHEDARHELPTGDAQAIVELLARHDFAGSILVGHDAHTGLVALAVRDLLNAQADGVSQVAVLIHTKPAAYKWLEGGDPEKIERKVERQREIVGAAEMVFGVGPKLHRTARDLLRRRIKDSQPRREPVMLIPGLAEIEPYADSPDQFQAMTFGRLDPRADRVKQGSLALAGFGGVISARYGDLGDDPQFCLVGANDADLADIRKLATEQAGRPIAVYAQPFTEDRAQLWNLLSKQSVSLMLSVHEGFGLTGWEAIAAGVPLVVSKNTGLYELLETHEGLGGMALGCVLAVDVHGSLDEDNFDRRDLAAVGEHLVRIARSPAETKRNALRLRELCLDAGLTWSATAENFARGCGLVLPESVELDRRADTVPRGPTRPPAGVEQGRYRAVAPEGWARVSFDHQRGLEAALSGESLGPQDVASCPRLAEVEELRVALNERNYTGLVGPSGSGKSLAIFHVAHDAEAAGAVIYRLTEPAAGVANVNSIHAERALLLVDDAHLLPPQTVSFLRDVATDDRKILFAGLDSIPGFVRPVIVHTKRAVVQLVEDMNHRLDEVRRVVQQIDRHVGEGYGDTPIERVLEDAAESKTPWQYMFVLGRGHLRSRSAIAYLERADQADLILLIISISQISRYDEGLERDELYVFARSYGRDEAWVDSCLRAVHSQGLLFSERGRVMTPHPRLAMAVIDLTIEKAWSMPVVREYLREMIVDESRPLRGRAWLIRELHFGDAFMVGRRALTPEIRTVLHGQLIPNDGSDEGMASSAWMLHALIRHQDAYSLGLMKATASWLVGLIHEAGRASGYALHNVVNEIHNADADWGRKFVADIDAGTMARKLVEADVDEFGAMAALVDRLLVCAGENWEEVFFAQLDYERLAARWQQWPIEHVHHMVSFSKFLVWRKTDKTGRLLRSMYPAVRRAFRSDVLVAWEQLRDLVLLGLGFSPLFDVPPNDHRLEIARELGELVDASDVGRALSMSRQRNWEPLAMLVKWLRVAAPDTSKQVAAFVTVEPLLEQARGLVKAMPRDLQMMFSMLVLNEEAQPFLSVIVELQDEIEVLPAQFAALAPSVGVHVLDRGGRLQWGLSGGLPRWRPATKLLTYLEGQKAGLATRFLESAVDEIADGLMFTQNNSSQQVGEFLSTAERVAPEVVSRACARLDPERAMEHWSARMADTRGCFDDVLEVLRFVGGRPGPAQSIARDLMREHTSPKAVGPEDHE